MSCFSKIWKKLCEKLINKVSCNWIRAEINACIGVVYSSRSDGEIDVRSKFIRNVYVKNYWRFYPCLIPPLVHLVMYSSLQTKTRDRRYSYRYCIITFCFLFEEDLNMAAVYLFCVYSNFVGLAFDETALMGLVIVIRALLYINYLYN